MQHMNLFQHTLTSAISALQTHHGKSISDRDIAKIYGGTPSNLSRWRKGQVNNEGADTLLRILQTLPDETARNILLKFRNNRELSKKPNKKPFQLGGSQFSTSELHLGIGILGGIGSGKTLAIIKPALKQLIGLYNQEEGEFSKIGGLILDPHGDLLPIIIASFLEADRPLSDIILIGPYLSEPYNPIDPTATAEENASKLSKAFAIIPSHKPQENKVCKERIENTLKLFLQLLEIYKPGEEINLTRLANFIQEMGDTIFATTVCEEIEKDIKENSKKLNSQDYLKKLEILTEFHIQWLELDQKARTNINNTVNSLLEHITTDPTLQEVFRRTTTEAHFQDVINQGKVVVFHDSGIAPYITKMMCRCLYSDFQTWTKRRNGYASEKYGLNTQRSLLFLSDEFQEFASFGDEGDESFAGVTRSTRIIQIIAAQSLNTLQTIGTLRQCNTFQQNIGTWIILRSTDSETIELCQRLALQTNLGDTHADQFQTSSLEKPRSGYSEGLLYHCLTKPTAQIVKFPLIFDQYPIQTQIEQKTQCFLSTFLSCAVSQKPDNAYKLELEETILADCLKTVRKAIISEFPEITPRTQKKIKPLPYRMLGKETMETSVSHDFDSCKTITWAAGSLSFCPHISIAIREEIQKNTLLPEHLKAHLLQMKNHNLLKVFQNILEKSKI